MIRDVRLQDFRSYEDSTFEFGDGVNIIVGPNASGKTNLLESIIVMAGRKSYRGRDQELVRFDKPWARIEAHHDEERRVIKIERTPTGAKKSFVINGQTLLRLPIEKRIATMVFEPEHLQILSGEPELRREYLDGLLEQTIIGFSKLRRDYQRVLAQRNALLKHGSSYAHEQLFAWNLRLSELGGQIVGHRLPLVEMLRQKIESLYQELAGKKTSVHLKYISSCQIQNYSSSLLHKLESKTATDLARGFTAYGPHRDDFMVELGRQVARLTASRGEIRTLVLTLKILELHLLEKARDHKPLLLLDDVFSELDGKRRQALTAHLSNYQTFITTTDADVVVQHFMGNCTIIPIG